MKNLIRSEPIANAQIVLDDVMGLFPQFFNKARLVSVLSEKSCRKSSTSDHYQSEEKN